MTENKGKKRCVVYCRKSVEDAELQSFNSIDAQRESGESYIASQKANGWVCVPTRYDDYGYSGGNTNRTDGFAYPQDMMTTVIPVGIPTARLCNNF